MERKAPIDGQLGANIKKAATRLQPGTRQAKISYLYSKPKQEVCQMDNEKLVICLMEKCLDLEKELESQKVAGDYWFQECERLKNEKEQ